METFTFLCLTGTLGLGYLIFRIKQTPDLLNTLQNRYMLYLVVTFYLALMFGIIGSNTRNNFIFFLSTICTELTSYFCLCWIKISKNTTAKIENGFNIILRPRLFFLLNFALLFELICFLIAGKEILSQVSLAKGEEDVKNFWVLLGSLTSLIFVCSSMIFFLVELYGAIKITAVHKIRYRYCTMALFILFFLLYFGVSTTALILLGVNLIGLAAYNLIVAVAGVTGTFPVFLLMAFLNFFDKKGYMLYQKVNDRFVRNYVDELKEFYLKTYFLFPSNYRFNTYDFLDEQPVDWMLKSVINQLVDIRILIWRIEAWLHSESEGVPIDILPSLGVVSVSYEAKVWHKFLAGKIDKASVVAHSQKIAPPNAVPSIQYEGAEQFARYFISLDKEILKISKRSNDGKPSKVESLLHV